MSDSETPAVGGGGPRVRPPQEPELVDVCGRCEMTYGRHYGDLCPDHGGEFRPKTVGPVSLRERAKLWIARFRALGGVPELCDVAWKLCQENESLAAQLTDLRGERDAAARRWDAQADAFRQCIADLNAANEALRGAGAALQRQLNEKIAECGRWKEAAYKKIRTWDVIQSRHRAGDSVEDLARDYGTTAEFIRFVLFPENDLQARYARGSDRAQTARADLAALDKDYGRLLVERDALEVDLARLRSRGQALVRAWLAEYESEEARLKQYTYGGDLDGDMLDDDLMVGFAKNAMKKACADALAAALRPDATTPDIP